MAEIGSFRSAAAAAPDARLKLNEDAETPVKTSSRKGKTLAFLKGNYAHQNVRIKQDFLKALRSEYGAAFQNAPEILANTKPLTGRQVTLLIESGEAHKTELKDAQTADSNRQRKAARLVTDFNAKLKTSYTTPNSFILQSITNDVLRTIGLPTDTGQFDHVAREAVSDIAAEFGTLETAAGKEKIPENQLRLAARHCIMQGVAQTRATDQNIADQTAARKAEVSPLVTAAHDQALEAIQNRPSDSPSASIGKTLAADLAARENQLDQVLDSLLDNAGVLTADDLSKLPAGTLKSLAKAISHSSQRDAIALTSDSELETKLANLFELDAGGALIQTAVTEIRSGIPSLVSYASAREIASETVNDQANMLGNTSIQFQGVRAPQPLDTQDVRNLLAGSGIRSGNPTQADLGRLATQVSGLTSGTPLVDELTMISSEELKSMIASVLGEECDANALDNLQVAIHGALPNRANSDTEITVDGTKYTQQRQIGAGGFGKVYLFASANGETLVVKKPLYDRDFPKECAKLREGMKQEVRAHRLAMRGTSEETKNIAQMQGPLQASNGDLWLAMDTYQHGDVEGIWKKGAMLSGERAGVLTPRATNLMRTVLAHDILDGMHHIQDRCNMMHFDLKHQNFFMDDGGTLKIGDFGVSEAGLEIQVDSEFQTTLAYQAPETAKNLKELWDAENAPKAPADPNGIDPSNTQVKTLTARNDTYATGILLRELYSGVVVDYQVADPKTGEYTPRKGLARSEQARIAAGDSDEVGIQAPTQQADGTAGPGASAVDRLINGLTNPDPESRITFEAALQSSVFSDAAFERPAVRELLPLFSDWLKTDKELKNPTNDTDVPAQTARLIAITTAIKTRCDSLGV